MYLLSTSLLNSGRLIILGVFTYINIYIYIYIYILGVLVSGGKQSLFLMEHN
jgi:hypothetical protein